MTAYIGYDNAFEQSGVTISLSSWSPPTGFGLANAYDYKTHTAIKTDTSGASYIKLDAGVGNTISADYFGVVGHNLFPSTTVGIESSTDDVSYTTRITSSPTDDGVIFARMSSVISARYWRFLVSSSSAGKLVSHVSFGQALQLRPLNAGLRPPVNELFEALNVIGGDANFLGRSVVRKPQTLTIRQTGINPADYRTNYKPFVDHALRKPFFFSWDYENYSDEAVYCWLDKNAPEPVYSHLCHMALDLRVQAIKS